MKALDFQFGELAREVTILELVIGNLDKINSLIRGEVKVYCQKLIDGLGDRIRSICVYGSATGPDYVKGKSNVNIALVVDRIDQALLDAIHKVFLWGRKHAIVAPLVLTREYIESSVDTFPIEFLEIKTSGVVVCGENYFQDLAFKNENIRHECEFQARSAFLRVQQAYLEIGRDRKGIERLLHTSMNSIIPLLRTLIRFKGLKPPTGKIDLVRMLPEAVPIETDVLLEILRDKAGDEKIGKKRASEIIGPYLQTLQSVIEEIDKLQV